MTVRIGLLGCGRLGRNIFRLLVSGGFADVQLKAIVDQADPKSVHYLLRYDSILGRFPGVITLHDDRLSVGNTQVRLLQGQKPEDVVNWAELGVDVVIDATRTPRSRAMLHKHIERGAKKVITCVPPLDEFDALVVMGVNHEMLTPAHTIIGHGSVSAHAALPILQVLEQKFGVERLFYTAVHAYTNDQRLCDVPADTLRRSRAAAQNIVPDNGSCTKHIEAIVPSLRGKVSGMSLKVPVANGSMMDMVTFTKRPVTVQSVNDAVHAAAGAGQLKHIIEYSTDALVSSDVKGSDHSCTFDALSTMVMGDRSVKTLAWFDNGWGYARRTVELAMHVHNLPGVIS
jgi:glyceraldehyde 3-phosphate dehydrogenase